MNTLLKRYKRWGAKHYSIEKALIAERLTQLQDQGLTLAQIGQKVGRSGEWVRQRITERTWILECESRRISQIDLTLIASCLK